MSNVGQAALGIVGGIIGFYLGGPQGAVYGFQLGLAVGTVVSPTQLPGTFGPKLSDNRTTTSQVGAPVVEIAGTDVTGGTVIWLGTVVEHATTTEVGGKGAPEQNQTTYSYTQSIAIGLCKGLRGQMAGILQIFENGKLVYDRRPQQPDEDAITFANRITASDTYELNFTLYLGTEDQLPDPTIEAEEGIGNVPAYRGLMYIVYTNRLLQDEQARRHPNFKFVVYDEGSLLCETVEDYSNDVLYGWNFLGEFDPRNACNEHTYTWTLGSFAPPRSTLTAALSDARDNDYPVDNEILGWNTNQSDDNGNLSPYFPVTLNADPISIYLWFNIEQNKIVEDGLYIQPPNVGLGWQECEWIKQHGPPFWWTGKNNGPEDFTPRVHGYYEYSLEYPHYGNLITNPVDFCEGQSERIFLTQDAPVEVTRVPQAPPTPCQTEGCGAGDYTPSDKAGYCYDSQGRLIQATPWVLDTVRSWHVLQSYGSSDPVTLPRNPARPDDHPEYNDQAFWEQAYADARDAGLVPTGWTFGVEYPQAEDHGYYRQFQRCTATTNLVSIADIVRAICNRCDLTDDLLDVEELADRYVNGYSLARVMDGRSAIAPLRSVGFFDAVESDGLVKFPVRGRAAARVLVTSDLGAHEYGEDQPPLVTTKQQDDVELPRQLFVQYRDPDRNYETGEQPSPTRLITDAVNDVYVDVAVAIGATQAAQCAEVLWADIWASRWQHAAALSIAHLDLDPTDVVLLPVDGRNERMRIVAIDDSSVILRQLQLVRDDDQSYVSAAIAEPPAVPPASMIFYAATQIVMLDLPPLRETDNDGGFYVAVGRAANGNRWSGASLYRTTDGATYAVQGSVANEALIGTVFSALPAADPQVWDEGNELIVNLPRGQFSSRPQAEVEEGANALAIGVHGRWEIVQFRDAELIANTRWRLTGLLRGRRGTDHNIGTSVAGDQAVLISGDGIIREPLTLAEVGRDLIYRAVTNGTVIGTGVDVTFAGSGEALRPFSPVHIHGSRDAADGALTITWMRRDRLLLQYEAGSTTPLSEVVEDYEIDILDTDGEVRRTISTNDTQAVYSAEMQITDFGVLQTSITLRIYQISVAIGRGHYREATL